MADAYRIARLANRDLESIWQFGSATWGDDRADAYVDMLYDAFEALARFPEIGMAQPELLEGTRTHFIGTHVVVYRSDGDLIEIIRLLHQSRDWRELIDT